MTSKELTKENFPPEIEQGYDIEPWNNSQQNQKAESFQHIAPIINGFRNEYDYSPDNRYIKHNHILSLQRSYGNISTLRLLKIQRSPTDDGDSFESPPSQSIPPTPDDTVESADSTQLIVEDSVNDLTSGQMRKSDFMSQLRTAVTQTAESSLSGTIWSSMGCPWIDHWISYYNTRSAVQIELAVRRYTTQRSPVTTAGAYIPLICSKISQSVQAWSASGNLQDIPPEIASSFNSGGNFLAGIANFGSTLAGGAGDILSGIGSLFRKENAGNAKVSTDLNRVQSGLSTGRPLDSSIRSRMEPAFGHDFSGVRLHTESRDAEISGTINARAFTIGKDIAFGHGEFKPGTLIGDALIAHELAHVIQQEGPISSAKQKNDTETDTLENQADLGAVNALTAIWSGLGNKSFSLIKTGLRLQRCDGCQSCQPSQRSLNDYNDTDPQHDPSRISDSDIERTQEFITLKGTHGSNYTKEEILLACRLIIRHMREGNSFNLSSDGITFLDRAKAQLGSMRGVEGFVNQLQWVRFSSPTAASNPAALQSEFGKWMLAGGSLPSYTTGQINCWEVILFGAYRAGYVTEARLRSIYNLGVQRVRAGTNTSVGDTVESELRGSREYVFDINNPSATSQPLAGDMIVFNRAATHAAIATGTITSTGEHEILSLWHYNSASTERTTIEEMLRRGVATPVKFWSVKWQ